MSPNFKLELIPNKGYGLLATRDFDEGDVIMEKDWPLLVVDYSELIKSIDEGNSTSSTSTSVKKSTTGKNNTKKSKPSWESLPRKAKEDFIQSQYDKIQDETIKAEIMDLYDKATEIQKDSNGDEEKGEHDEKTTNSEFHSKTPFGVFHSNHWGGPKPEIGALLRTVSRINHSCDDNCAFRWVEESDKEDNGISSPKNTNSPTKFYATIYALQPIKTGEELLISYIGEEADEWDFVKRRDVLKEKWNFECTCGKCVDEEREEKEFMKFDW